MDKNMIKIDDLLRQRLADGEEQDRPAAWLQMRDLLDKQMPVTRAAVNWRRMFGYIAGVALLAAVGVGGYEVSQSFDGSPAIAGNTTPGNSNGAANIAPVTTGLAGSAINSLPDTRAEAEAAKLPAQATDINGSSVSSTTGAAGNSANTQGTATTNHNNLPSKANRGSDNVAANTTNGNNPAYNQPGNTYASAGAATGAKNATDGNLATNNNNTVANNTQAATTASNKNVTNSNPATNNNNFAAKNQQAVATTSDKNAVNSNPATNNNKNAGLKADKITPASGGNTNSNNTPALAKANQPATGNGAKNADGNKTSQEFEEKKVPVKKIEREEKIDKNGVARMDTIFNGEDVRTIQVPKDQLIAKNDDDLNSGSNMNPSAAYNKGKKQNSTEEAPMVKLGDKKVSSKQMKNFNPSRFEEVVRNAKYTMGTVKFYPGIVGGANMAFNGNFGIHGGLVGNLTIGDRWSILTEVKYAFRFNNVKENMQDDYIDNVTNTVHNGQVVYNYDSMQHFYTFSNYKSLEIPLMVTYTSNQRFVYMGGVNFRYNFAINNLTEVEQKYKLGQASTSTNEVKFETDKQILLTDFSSSLNIAPMLGFGYKLSPAWMLDCRLSKSVWNNNSNTTGQKEIYKRLYNMPQVQLNLTYRISNNKYKPYKKAQ